MEKQKPGMLGFGSLKDWPKNSVKPYQKPELAPAERLAADIHTIKNVAVFFLVVASIAIGIGALIALNSNLG